MWRWSEGEALENGKVSSHSAHANGMNELTHKTIHIQQSAYSQAQNSDGTSSFLHRYITLPQCSWSKYGSVLILVWKDDVALRWVWQTGVQWLVKIYHTQMSKYLPSTHSQMKTDPICAMCHFCGTVHDGHSVQTSSLQVYVTLSNHKKCPLSQNVGYEALTNHTVIFTLWHEEVCRHTVTLLTHLP
jgi:hypothetical protein